MGEIKDLRTLKNSLLGEFFNFYASKMLRFSDDKSIFTSFISPLGDIKR